MDARTVADARGVADACARRGGLQVRPLESMADLMAASSLFAAVWGTTAEGVPVHSEVLRSLVHAGGLVSGAYADGDLVGAAVLAPAAGAGEGYGMIAASAPGVADRGVGRALKQHQRAWGLEHEYVAMSWTFDPLVARNAHLNLTTLGALAVDYVPAFYGTMSDAINGSDEADRLVARWEFASPRTVAAAVAPVEPRVPDTDAGEPGPDGEPSVVRADGDLWLRAPRDIVELRRGRPALAKAWRAHFRGHLTTALADGLVGTGCSRSSWYVFTAGG